MKGEKLGIIICVISLLCLINSTGLIKIIISLELLLLSIGILFLHLSFIFDDMIGALITLYLLPLAGAESAIILAILIAYYPIRGTLELK